MLPSLKSSWIRVISIQLYKMNKTIRNEFVEAGRDGNLSKIQDLIRQYSKDIVNAKDDVSCILLTVDQGDK